MFRSFRCRANRTQVSRGRLVRALSRFLRTLFIWILLASLAYFCASHSTLVLKIFSLFCDLCRELIQLFKDCIS